MEADLNLAQTLGGLRIANPDDNPSPASSAAGSVRSKAPMSLSPLPHGGGAERARSPLAVAPNLQTGDILRSNSPLDFNPGAFSTDSVPPEKRASPSPRFGSPKLRDQTASSRYPGRQSMPYTYQEQQQAQFPHYPTMMPLNQRSSSSAMRPVSAMYTQQQPLVDDQSREESRRIHRESSRSSMYNLPHLSRSNSRGAATAMQAGVPINEGKHTERTYKQSPLQGPNGIPPPRKSSRHMSSSQLSNMPSRNSSQAGLPYAAESSTPPSSEEWKEKGAAVGLRREVDASGNQVVKHIKKGVKDFQFGRTLGEGSYSTVIFATDRQSGKEHAIKVLDKRHIIKEKKVKYVNIEKDTLNRLTDHPGVVRLYYTFQDEQSLYFVLDLASGGELLGVLKQTTTFNEECTRFYGAEILDTIEYMHAKGVIHRDLKPENVLLDEHSHVKITDFGTAKILDPPERSKDGHGFSAGNPMEGFEETRANSFVGTAEYVSPELLTDKKACKASDLWAFGCIIYQLIAGRPPFKGGHEYMTFQKIVALDYKFPPGFPEVAKDLVERLLVLDPASRLTIEHIKNHEFFRGVNWGRGLWRTKAPKLKPFVPSAPEPRKLNGQSNGASFPPNIAHSHSVSEKRFEPPKPQPRVITELPPPSQLDIEWSPVLTNINERILKLGNLIVNTTPKNPHHSPNGKIGLHQNGDPDTPKKFSRFFGGGHNAAKKRQRLVMVTSSARIIIVAEGGGDKKSKVEVDLRGADCSWNKLQDSRGLTYWCVDTPDKHITFESPLPDPTPSTTATLAQDWLDIIDRSRSLALTTHPQSITNPDYTTNDSLLKDPSSSRALDLDVGWNASGAGSGGGGRHRLEKAGPGDGGERGLGDGPGAGGGGGGGLGAGLGGGGGGGFLGVGRKRFSKRQSKSGLAAVF